MRYLLDTHYLIWSLLDPDKLEPSKKTVLVDPVSVKYISKVTFWEIALKFSLGKLELKGITPEDILESSLEAGYEILDVSEDDLATSYKLARSANHKDPFDRLLVWQCIRNDLIFISADRKVQEYAKSGLKLCQ